MKKVCLVYQDSGNHRSSFYAQEIGNQLKFRFNIKIEHYNLVDRSPIPNDQFLKEDILFPIYIIENHESSQIIFELMQRVPGAVLALDKSFEKIMLGRFAYSTGPSVINDLVELYFGINAPKLGDWHVRGWSSEVYNRFYNFGENVLGNSPIFFYIDAFSDSCSTHENARHIQISPSAVCGGKALENINLFIDKRSLILKNKLSILLTKLTNIGCINLLIDADMQKEIMDIIFEYGLCHEKIKIINNGSLDSFKAKYNITFCVSTECEQPFSLYRSISENSCVLALDVGSYFNSSISNINYFSLCDVQDIDQILKGKLLEVEIDSSSSIENFSEFDFAKLVELFHCYKNKVMTLCEDKIVSEKNKLLGVEFAASI